MSKCVEGICREGECERLRTGPEINGVTGERDADPHPEWLRQGAGLAQQTHRVGDGPVLEEPAVPVAVPV